jgi:hypothetical protein
MPVVTNDVTIDAASAKDLHKIAADEAFMHELVTINVHPTTDENSPPYVILSVNGTNCPVPRGRTVDIKRKYVEVLARMKETRYNQIQGDSGRPDDLQLVARTGLCYPFDMIEDKNPRGRAWLSKVLAEAA